MSHDESFEFGIKNAKSDVRSMMDERAAVGQFFNEVSNSLTLATQAKNSIYLEVDNYSLRVNDKVSGQEIGRMHFDISRQQFYYSDFRKGPNYPLPPNWSSLPVALSYMGLSVGYFRAKQADPKLELLGSKFSENRDFFSLSYE